MRDIIQVSGLASLLWFCAMLLVPQTVWGRGGMPAREAHLAQLIEKVAQQQDTVAKLEANAVFAQHLKEVLAEPEAFAYDFAQLPYTYKVQSDDGLLRLVTWLVPLGASYQYFGYVLLKEKKKSRVHRLITLHDRRGDASDAQGEVQGPASWFGCVYTSLVTKRDRSNKQVYYTLLGFSLNDAATSRKVIEVLVPSGDSVVFGAPIFAVGRAQPLYRVVIEYQAGGSLPLHYDAKRDLILYTRAVPMYRQLTNRHEMYVADEGYVGLKFKKGNWEMVPETSIKSNIKGREHKRPQKSKRGTDW